MAYNLPPAWDAGFALPKNVRDEGLERRALVTKWMPRGTYDDSTDGTAGYNVPQYIKDEGIGQGAFTTFWQPRGTYNGGKVPHWLNKRPVVTNVVQLPGGAKQVTVQPAMGDDAPVGEPFDTYGQKAAATLISSVASLPQGQRQKVMKSMMDRLDKSLWARTQTIFNRYVQQKMPPADAFPLALARALSTGIAAEIITTGARRVAPQANSLLGLGCYGCAAFLGAMGGAGAPVGLGAVVDTGGGTGPGGEPIYSPPVGPKPSSSVPVITGTTPPPKQPAYDWFVGPFAFSTQTFQPRVWGVGNAPSSTVANRAAAPDIMYISPDVNYTPTVADMVIGKPSSMLTGTVPYFMLAQSPVRPLSAEVLAWLKARLTEAVDASGNTDTPTTYLDPADNRHPSSFLFDADGNTTQGQAADATQWFNAMGIQPDTPVRLHVLWNLKTAGSPLAKTKHIKTGDNMALVVQLAPLDATKSWSTSNPLVLKVWLSTIPDPSIFGALWNPMVLINPLTALGAVDSVLAGVAPILGGLACDVLTNPAAGAAAGAAAAAYGIPPQAGTTGVAIAAGQCGQAPPPVVPPQRSILPWVLLGGGALVAVAVLTKPKTKKATP